jgi:dolichol-phosphate mannosyltransferase
MTRPAVPEISVVVPAWNEENNIEPLYREFAAALDPLGSAWEVVFADDGSSDGTWTAIARLHALNQRVKGVRLSRNFGHQSALLCGLVHAEGRAVVSLDADLQHPPAVIPEMIGEWRKGSLVVHTVRIDTENQGVLKRLTSRLFYRVYSLLTGSKVDPGMADFRLLDRQVLDELLKFPEGGLYLRGLVSWVGFPSTRVAYHCRERHSGETKYSPRRMLKFAWTAITSFSLIPLRIGVGIGILTAGIAFTMIVYALTSYFMGLATLPGWASLLSVISFLFGILFILIGIIGEYIGRVVVEVKQRPRFLVHERIGTTRAASTPVPSVRS